MNRSFLKSFLLWGFCVTAHAETTPLPTEYEVKAAFLYNFAKFVEWPEATWASATDSFVICIIGNDPFGPDIQNEWRTQTVQEHKILIQHIPSVEEARACQILFVAASEQSRAETILQQLKHPPILTVGDDARFVSKGGMISFVLEKRRVRFHVNTVAAEAAGLKISSQLLKLAKTVQTNP
jgi:hypothetical protein